MLIPSILLIDDDEIDAEAVQRAFRQHKLANPIIHAVDGIMALEILREKSAKSRLTKPYIILLDINMPRMGGLEFLHELRRDPNLTDSVVFMLTTSNSHEDKLAAYREHIAGYILKQNVGADFTGAIQLLTNYQTLVVLPD